MAFQAFQAFRAFQVLGVWFVLASGTSGVPRAGDFIDQ